jgi:hypothetical protein
VYTTWDISFQRLSKPAAQFLQLCSFLHHEGITESIFVNAAKCVVGGLEFTEDNLKEPRAFLRQFSTDSGGWDAMSFADMTAEVLGYSLMNKNPDTDVFSVHPLVHNWGQNTISDVEGGRNCAAAIIAMSAGWADEVFRIGLMAHVQALVQGDPESSNRFPLAYAGVYYDSGRFLKATELYAGALEQSKEFLGSEHLDTVNRMSDLACSHRALGKFTSAEQLEVVVLEKCQHLLGTEHPHTHCVQCQIWL